MKSESIKELAAALSKAQGEIKNAKKDSKNPFFASRYASLEAVREEVNPVFAKYGLAMTQFPCSIPHGSGHGLCTTLMHESGEWIDDIMDVSPVKTRDKDKQGNFISDPYVSPQALGSSITYARRYALMGVAGIAPEDDDGNAGTGHSSASIDKRQEEREAKAQEVASLKNWKDFVCHLGGLKGKKLGDMSEEELQKVYQYITEKQKKTQEDNTLFAALSVAIGEKKKDDITW